MSMYIEFIVVEANLASFQFIKLLSRGFLEEVTRKVTR